MASSISIEETNKIRKSLGLPLLPVPGGGPVFKAAASEPDSEEELGSTLESRQAQSYENYKRVQNEHKEKLVREARKEAIRKARDEAARNVKLEGHGLGEADDEDQGTRAWLMSQKKRQRKIEQEREKTLRLEQELKERENQLYTTKDLAGIRVAHEVGHFGDDDEHVLVLKDTTIDENEEEGDELENVDLKDQERREERLKLKKKKPVYNPNEVDENGERGILSQYDELIDGKKRKRFTLDVDGQTVEQKQAAGSTLGEQTKRQAISLDVLKDLPQSDYAEPKEIKMRKAKKQKSKSTRKRPVDDDDYAALPPMAEEANGHPAAEAMDVDGTAKAPASRSTMAFIDDDDLQASLARQRREALKRRRLNRPEELAKQVRDEEENGMQEDEVDDAERGGLVIDETSFFVSGIDKRQQELAEEQEAEVRRRAEAEHAAVKTEAGSDSDTEMAGDARGIEDNIKRENSSDLPGAADTGEMGETTTGLGDEGNFKQGLGGTLGILKSRGAWDALSDANVSDTTRDSIKFRSQKHKLESEFDAAARAQRLAGREAGTHTGYSQREREELNRKENESRNHQNSVKMQQLYNSYKPSFEITHKDEFGREMGPQEAFKMFSHQFHGKGSGKMKTEKRLKKIEEEKKNEAKSLMDNSQMSNYSNAADATAKRRGTVGVQLGK